jgi:Zn finger protein HypA/HybF involved in hydrogenase expression
MNKCIDCNKKLSRNPNAKRCKSCARKNVLKINPNSHNWKGKFGKFSNNFINDKTFNNKCTICGIHISFAAIKCNHCAKTGIYHPNWIDGRSYEPYTIEFTEGLKEQIRNRDNHICQNPECNMTEEEHIIVFGKVLTIHHIDYNKQNCSKSNLITLCYSCNTRANFNRNYWKEFYSKKLQEIL